MHTTGTQPTFTADVTTFNTATLPILGYSIESSKLFHAVLDVLRKVWKNLVKSLQQALYFPK